jgi:ribosomal protein S18 acetylase RimI-like enzyme
MSGRTFHHLSSTDTTATDNAPTVRLATVQDDIPALADLINAAYKVGETGILVDSDEYPFLRVTVADVEAWIQAEKLLVLTAPTTTTATSPIRNESSSEQSVWGCVKVEIVKLPHNPTKDSELVCGEWGCLAVTTRQQRHGYGRLLVHAAENHAHNQLHCTHIRLELLAPTDWKQAHKERLREWYTGPRLGYQLLVPADYDKSTHRLPSGELLGGKFLLATNADFTTYRKKL